MLREFTRELLDAKGSVRFAKGQSEDYPQSTWDQIESSARRPLGTFTKALGETPRTHVQQAEDRSRREEHQV